VGSLGHPGGILCGILCGICTTCDGPHVTRDTRVGLVAGGCPRGWLGSWVLSLACPSTRGDSSFSQCSSMSRQLAYGRSLWGKVDSGFEHLQSIISCGSSSKSTSNCSVRTKTNVRFEAMKHLLLTALQLLSAANVLKEYIKVICSDQSSRTLIVKKSQHLKKYIVPMMTYTANSVAEISKSLAPILSVNYVHRRMDVKRRSDIVDESSNSHISPDLQLVCDYVAHEERKKRGDNQEITPPKKKLRVLSRHDRRLSSDDVMLPLPANGHEYSKLEVAKILSAYQKGTRKMSSVINKMIELKYVPCGIRTLCRLVVRATNGEQPVLDTDCISTGGGCPPIASLDEIKTIAVSMESQSGHVWSESDVSRALSDYHIKKIEEAGFVSLSQPE
jgi:hypothetical protein